MFTAIVVSLLVIASLLSLRQDGKGTLAMINHTPYNNRHSDASGAREDHLG